MSGKLARERGRKFEIEVAKAFSEHFDREFKRKLGQARDSGNDIDVGPFVVECKRTRRLGFLAKWMQQAVDAVAKRSEPFTVPIVVSREDEGRALVTMHLCDFMALAERHVHAYYEEKGLTA